MDDGNHGGQAACAGRAAAKGVLFIAIEDETGIANGILWPDRFEAQRRTLMSAAMIGMKGRSQKEGQVIHVICDRIIDHGPLLAQVGQMDFPMRPDGVTERGTAARPTVVMPAESPVLATVTGRRIAQA